MLTGIYYGAMYGGSTTSILLNIPGEASSVVTCIDGYRMAKKGRAGAALAIAAIGSFIAGTFSVVALMAVALPLAKAAVRFGPPEYFSLCFLGLVALSHFAGKSFLKSLAMTIFGLMLGTIGLDLLSGVERITLGREFLMPGIDFIPVVMGLYGITEVLIVAEESTETQEKLIGFKFRELLPTREELNRSIFPIFRGSLLGFLIGMIPGPSPIIASFLSYGTEKRVCKHREEMGHGAIEGVAGPESANNSAVGGALVPLLALGIPFTPSSALFLSMLMIHGIIPGPLLASDHPSLFWGVIASMYIGNFMLLVLNFPLISIFINILKVPSRILMPIVLLLCILGVFSVNNSLVDIWIMMLFGLLGFMMRKGEFDPAPVALAVVIGPVIEKAFRHSLMLSRGEPSIFITRPFSCIMLAAAFVIIIWPLLWRLIRMFLTKSRNNV
jgi:putative tricarboxylic transport membrane protein